MDGADLRAAEVVLAGLGDAARGQARTLAARLRFTGPAATLRWLRVGAANDGRGELLDRLEAALGVQVRELDALDTASRIRLQERAVRLGDALHVLVRADRGGH